MSDVPLVRVVADGGSALSGAQQELVGGALPATMAVSEVELEIKAAFSEGAEGMALHPIGITDVVKGTIPPGLVSTMKVRYTAVVDAEPVQARPSTPVTTVLDQVRQREDVARLDGILGGLDLKATFVADHKRWIVSAFDSDGRLVRDLVVDD